MSDERGTESSSLPRRAALRALLGVGLATGLEGCGALPEVAPSAPDPARGPSSREPPADSVSAAADSSSPDAAVAEHVHPGTGDRLVFAFGSREGEVIAPEDIRLGGPQVFAYSMDGDASHVASESRLGQIMLVRLDPAQLSEQTAANAADGIVAYSAVCTHTGCEISDWASETRRFKCPCHDSEFDPGDNGRVRGGPAPRRLAALPLTIVDGSLVVAGGFTGRVGAQRR